MDEKFTIVGTGSRELVKDSELFQKVFSLLVQMLTGAKARHGEKLLVISGMAEGFDEALAKAAMRVGVPLLAAIPNRGYSRYYWENNSMLGLNRIHEFQEMAKYARETGGVHYVCEKIYQDGRHSNFVRNEWMVHRADIVWVYNPTTRGTNQCYRYCRDNGIKTFIIGV